MNGNHKKTDPCKIQCAQKMYSKLLPGEEIEKVPLSVILPVYNCSEAIGRTLESIQQQNYPSLEIIVVDARSSDRTLEIVNSFAPLISRTYTVAHYNLGDMINRGISLCSGAYVSILYPGSFYLSPLTYKTFAEKITSCGYPDLVYCGSIQREIKRQPLLILLPFQTRLLENGQQPAAIPACWFKLDLFEKMGKFKVRYTARAGFDFFCRFAQEENVRSEMIDRVFVDFDYGRFSYGKMLKFAADTGRILWERFGFFKAAAWFLTLNHFAILKGIWSSLKLRLSKK